MFGKKKNKLYENKTERRDIIYCPYGCEFDVTIDENGIYNLKKEDEFLLGTDGGDVDMIICPKCKKIIKVVETNI